MSMAAGIKIGWINKDALIQRMKSLKGYEKLWRSALRRFWVCKLINYNPPLFLIKYLNEK
jgi:hypothetical protein